VVVLVEEEEEEEKEEGHESGVPNHTYFCFLFII
jgi:hypothetical protein